MKKEIKQANDLTREAWNTNAGFWDKRMGEGNDWFKTLIWPSAERMLEIKPGEMVLDAACGNGLTSRLMAKAGAHIIGFDFAEGMVAAAKKRSKVNGGEIEYLVLDATNEKALLELGKNRFDAALCNMALFDIADIVPLINAVAKLLKPGGRFVFSIMHPCFNNMSSIHVAEQIEENDEIYIKYGIKVYRYLTSYMAKGIAMVGQPQPQIYFERPLQEIFGVCFKAGLVLDAMDENSFPPETPSWSFPFSWGGKYSDIPPVIVARMRRIK